jgi:hypothetical protein
LVLMTREGKSNNAMHGLSEFERAYYCWFILELFKDLFPTELVT